MKPDSPITADLFPAPVFKAPTLTHAQGWDFVKAPDGTTYIGCQSRDNERHGTHVRVVPSPKGTFSVAIAQTDDGPSVSRVTVDDKAGLTTLLALLRRQVLGDPALVRSPRAVRCMNCLHRVPSSVGCGPFKPEQAPGGCALGLTSPDRRPTIYPVTGHFCPGWWPKTEGAAP